jgi:hypothetical protein
MQLLTVVEVEVLFILAVFLPLVIQLVVLYVVSRALWRFTQRFFGRGLWLVLALFGVPVHELSHAVAFILTGAGVRRVVLFAPRGLAEYGGATGVVVPRRQPSALSRLVASVAPFFGCSLAAWLVLRVLLPDMPGGQPGGFLTLEELHTSGLGELAVGMVGRYLRSLLEAFGRLDWRDWHTYPAVYLAASLGMGAAPSTEDFKRFFPALTGLLVAFLPVFALLQVLGGVEAALEVTQGVLDGLFIPVGSVLGYATLFGAIALAALAVLAPLAVVFRRR